MPDFDAWVADDVIGVMSAETRAALAWRRISDRPTSIIITRAKTQIAAQTVRIEWDNTATDHLNPAVNTITAVQKATVFGVRDHATEPDTDIQRSDRFRIEGVDYQVVSIMTPPGEVQAICEATRAT